MLGGREVCSVLVTGDASLALLELWVSSGFLPSDGPGVLLPILSLMLASPLNHSHSIIEYR